MTTVLKLSSNAADCRVKSGHQYTLSFMGTVNDVNGVGETVSSSTMKYNYTMYNE